MTELHNVEIRRAVDPAGDADWLAVFNAVAPCLARGPVGLRFMWELAPDHLALVARRRGRPVACAAVVPSHWTDDPALCEAEVFVLPGERRSGLGGALATRIAEWALARGHETMDVGTGLGEPDGAAYWKRRGFAEVGRDRVAFLDVASCDPGPPVGPNGLSVTTLAARPDLVEALFPVAQEVNADIPAPEPILLRDLDEFRAGELEIPGVSPETVFVALVGDEVAGYGILRHRETRPALNHEITGVARRWRGHGIARAIKRAQVIWARESGVEALEAGNDVANAPMLAINRDLGYVEAAAWAWLRGAVEGIDRRSVA